MFDIDESPRFIRTVDIQVPQGRGTVPQSIDVEFEALDIDEWNGFDLGTPEGARSFLVRAIVGIDGVIDKLRAPVPYSDGLRDRLIAKPWVRQPMIRAYLVGIGEAARGN